MNGRVAVRRALVSVWDRTGLVEFARTIVEVGAEVVSTGGTAAALREAGLPVLEVAAVTGFPEILDGRVKTLHPFIHAGLLADRTKPEHMSTLERHGIVPIDLVASNLYPFDTDVLPSTPLAEAVELIDIGGPSMTRAAAKNFDSVTIVVDPADYRAVADELKAGGVTAPTRRWLAAKAFRRLSHYDAAVAAHLERA